ncbi:MAG: glycine cleavage T C-terminal barrel domain-containing protein, partial [Pseudomonadota bacterium]
LVGLVPVQRKERFQAGSILFPQGQKTGHGLGHVSSVADSPEAGSWIGLGFVKGGLSTWGDKVITAENPIDGQSTDVTVVSPHFYDPTGDRMHG